MFAPCQCHHTPRAAGAGLTTSHCDAVSLALNAYHSRDAHSRAA